MKNIPNAYKILLLIAIFITTNNTYAIGNKYTSINNFENYTNTNDQLVDKLIASKDFEIFINKTVVLIQSSNALFSIKSEQERQDILEKIDNEKEKNEINSEESAIKTLRMIGFNESLSTKINKTMHTLAKNLKLSIPELNTLTEYELQNVFEKALQKGDMINKAFLVLTKEECYNDAYRLFGECTTNGTWFKGIVGSITVGCAVFAVACVAVAALATGPGAIAFAQGLLPLVVSCATAGATYFSLTSGNSPNCTNEFNARIASCVAQFGTFDGGGAN